MKELGANICILAYEAKHKAEEDTHEKPGVESCVHAWRAVGEHDGTTGNNLNPKNLA